MSSIVAMIMAFISAFGLYPKAGYIVDMSQESMVIEDATGNLWEVNQNADDYCVGDGVSMIMFDAGTPRYIHDDIVVSIRYNGFWQ